MLMNLIENKNNIYNHELAITKFKKSCLQLSLQTNRVFDVRQKKKLAENN